MFKGLKCGYTRCQVYNQWLLFVHIVMILSHAHPENSFTTYLFQFVCQAKQTVERESDPCTYFL